MSARIYWLGFAAGMIATIPNPWWMLSLVITAWAAGKCREADTAVARSGELVKPAKEEA